MFDGFGEMSSYKEINELAENLFNEGDMKSLKEMAMENGIPAEMISAYCQGDLLQLCDVTMAAIGKLEIEEKELKPKQIMLDWLQYIKTLAMENEIFAYHVREKGKSLKGCIAELLSWSFKNQIPVDKDILAAANVKAGKVTLGIPGMGEAKKIIRNYYMGGRK